MSSTVVMPHENIVFFAVSFKFCRFASYICEFSASNITGVYVDSVRNASIATGSRMESPRGIIWW
jgi:hypothetical protein